jgi:hypothetical protein
MIVSPAPRGGPVASAPCVCSLPGSGTPKQAPLWPLFAWPDPGRARWAPPAAQPDPDRASWSRPAAWPDPDRAGWHYTTGGA